MRVTRCVFTEITRKQHGDLELYLFSNEPGLICVHLTHGRPPAFDPYVRDGFVRGCPCVTPCCEGVINDIVTRTSMFRLVQINRNCHMRFVASCQWYCSRRTSNITTVSLNCGLKKTVFNLLLFINKYLAGTLCTLKMMCCILWPQLNKISYNKEAIWPTGCMKIWVTPKG